MIILETAYFCNYTVFSILILFFTCSAYSSGYKFADLEIHIILNTSLYKEVKAFFFSISTSEKNQLGVGRSEKVGNMRAPP